MNELQILTNIKPGVIEFNNESIKQSLLAKREEFRGNIIQEDSVPIMKKQVASWRSINKDANAARISVKKEYMKVYDEFDLKVKELTGIVDEMIDEQTVQLDAFEEKRKACKKQEIEELYINLIDGFEEYLPLSKIYDSKWENTSTTIKSITDQITTLIDSTAQAINTITAMNSDAVPKALERFKADLSLANAITYITNYEQQKAEIEARAAAQRKADEEERIRAEEQRKIAEQQRLQREVKAAEERTRQESLAYIEQEKEKARIEAVEEIKVAEQEKIAPLAVKEPIVDEPQLNILFSITATESEFTQIEMYLDSIGVEYAKED